MDRENINKLISAYVDGELTDPSELNEIKDLVERDRSLNVDYTIQHLMKSIITERLKIQLTPEKVKKKIIRKIKPSKNFLTAFFSRGLP